MNMFLNKEYDKFDSYERTVFDWNSSNFDHLVHNKTTDYTNVYEYVEFNLKNNKNYKNVRYKDLWDLIVFIELEMAKHDYSGNLKVYPVSMSRDFNKSLKSLCCGINHYRYSALSNNKYLIAFDHSH
jgi:hypothetical protein